MHTRVATLRVLQVSVWPTRDQEEFGNVDEKRVLNRTGLIPIICRDWKAINPARTTFSNRKGGFEVACLVKATGEKSPRG